MSVMVMAKKPALSQVEGEKTAKRTAAEMGTFVDSRDGTEYKTCKIGNQVWLAENLKFELDSDDCHVYDDDYQYFDKYGYLYNEDALKTAIPEGWHLPTRKEWETMIRFAKKDSRCKDVLSVIASEEWIEIGPEPPDPACYTLELQQIKKEFALIRTFPMNETIQSTI